MRFTGNLKTWNDAKGFGFLTPTQRGQDIFVHISALPKGMGAPTPGQVFTFEVELNREGKKRAVRVQVSGPSSTPAELRSGHRPPRVQTPSPHRRRRTLSPWVIGVLLVSTAGFIYVKFAGQQYFTGRAADVPPIVEQPLPTPRTATPTSPAAQTYRCDGRTHCSQMSSCAEARFFLSNCPGSQMDGNGDGEPCEQQWCTAQR